MRSPFRESSKFQVVGPFFVSDREKGLDITLAESPGGRMEDAQGLGFNHTIEMRFSKARLWIPCFSRNEKYTLNFRGIIRQSSYISIFAIPGDVAKIAFLEQFLFIFGRAPSSDETKQFWSDIEAALNIFLQKDRSYYEESVASPRDPRFVIFDHRVNLRGSNWTTLDWREVASSALAAMNAVEA